jgi:hypothetical protein
MQNCKNYRSCSNATHLQLHCAVDSVVLGMQAGIWMHADQVSNTVCKRCACNIARLRCLHGILCFAEMLCGRLSAHMVLQPKPLESVPPEAAPQPGSGTHVSQEVRNNTLVPQLACCTTATVLCTYAVVVSCSSTVQQ